MKNEIKALGVLITRELGLKNDYDVLNKWMITYIAEQMTKYESAETEEERQATGERCSDVIVKFWRKRAYNVSQNPFTEYKELYDGLRRLLADENEVGFSNFLSQSDGDNDKLAEIVRVIKRSASWLIEDQLISKNTEVKTDDIDEWLQVATKLDDGDDARIIELIMNAGADYKKMEAKIIQERICTIEDVILLYRNLINQYKSQIDSD